MIPVGHEDLERSLQTWLPYAVAEVGAFVTDHPDLPVVVGDPPPPAIP